MIHSCSPGKHIDYRADQGGARPTFVPSLPIQCTEITITNMAHLLGRKLSTKAIMERRAGANLVADAEHDAVSKAGQN